MKPTDKASDYFNFSNPNYVVQSGLVAKFVHRLGTFDCVGIGQRKIPVPNAIILHVPVYDDPYLANGDDGAEVMAKYLANPPENNPSTNYYKDYLAKYKKPPRKIASVHACADRDSFILCQPADSVAYSNGNLNTYATSWDIEIAGLGTETPTYWKSKDAELKLIQSAKAIIKSFQLSFGDEWESCIPPRQKAVFMPNGVVAVKGFSQHREVPYAVYLNGAFSRWAQYPENLKYGQHSDICEDFPFDYFFKILDREIEQTKQGL